MASIDSIVVRSIRFWQLQCIYLSSRTFKFYFNFMFYFSYLLIDFLPFSKASFCALTSSFTAF